MSALKSGRAERDRSRRQRLSKLNIAEPNSRQSEKRIQLVNRDSVRGEQEYIIVPLESWVWSRGEVLPCSSRMTILFCKRYIWVVSRQLSQRAAREPQIVLFLTHIYDTKMCFKKLFDERFRRIFSSAFQWRRQFFRNFPFSPQKSTKRVISQKVYF